MGASHFDYDQPNYRLSRRYLGRVYRRYGIPVQESVWDAKFTKFAVFALGALGLYLLYSRR